MRPLGIPYAEGPIEEDRTTTAETSLHPPQRPVRVFLVGPQRLFLDALAQYLGANPMLQVVGNESDSAVDPASLAASDTDVLVVDMEGDEGVGHSLIVRVLQERMVPAVVALAADDHLDAAVRAVRAGARGLAVRSEGLDDLVEAIGTVRDGGTRLPDQMRVGILDRVQRLEHADDDVLRRLELLTDREREVLRLLAAGADRPEISATLFISSHTVRTHIQRILTKLGAHSQLEAVSMALRAGTPDGGSRAPGDQG